MKRSKRVAMAKNKTAQERSASSIAGGAARGCHLLKIDCYSRTTDFPGVITSPPFAVGGLSWSIQYSTTEDNKHIFLLLQLLSDVAAVNTRCKFSVLDKTGEPITGCVDGDSPAGDLISFYGKNCSLGQFITTEELEAGGCLDDDAFTLRCDITVFHEVRAEEDARVHATSVEVPPSDLPRHLGGLLASGDAADVTFTVGGGETVAAHRFLLAARSPVFKAELLAGGAKESAAAIPVHDMEPDVFKAMLYFIYTDSLLETTTTATAVFFQRLFVAADGYDIPRLKLACESELCGHVGVETAAAMLALAEQRHCRGLKRACFEFLSSPANMKDFMANDGLEHLASTCPSVIKDLIAKLVD